MMLHRTFHGSLLGVVLFLSQPAHAQSMIQGPAWTGRDLDVHGTAIGWQERLRGGCLLVLLDAGRGRVWACSTQAIPHPEHWILDGRHVHVSGRVEGVQRTRVGGNWRWAPRLENARITTG